MRNNVLLSDVKDILFYVFGTFIVTYFFWGLIVFANNRDLFLYGSRYFYVLFILGGIAPTVFGYIVSKKNGNVKNAFFLIKECYKLKQTVLNYAILGLFLVLTFITPVFSGKATYHVSSWYCFFLLSLFQKS